MVIELIINYRIYIKDSPPGQEGWQDGAKRQTAGVVESKISELLYFVFINSTTPSPMSDRYALLFGATPPGQVFHPDIERSEIIGKGCLVN